MPLKIELIDGINPFIWEHFTCPLCEHNQFTSIAHAGVYCDECNARFVVRDTAGDPGCVVDCFATRDKGAFVYAPAWHCLACEKIEEGHCHQNYYRFGWQDLTCPHNLNHGQMERIERVSGPWTVTKDCEYFYLILKLNDYCSGWLLSGALSPRKERRGPNQAQWDAFQRRDCQPLLEAYRQGGIIGVLAEVHKLNP